MNKTNQKMSAEDIEALLPWYAAGTLEPREADEVEAALAADTELARRLELVREEMTEAILLNEALGVPSARVMEKAGKVVAYVIVFKINEGYEVAEWGGEVKNVIDLIASVLPKPSTGIVWISIYPGCELYRWALDHHEGQVRTPTSCMVKILNLGKVLKAFESQLQARYESHSLRNLGSLSLQLPGQEKVTLNFGRKLQVETGVKNGKPLMLTQSQCIRLLFGGTSPSYELKLKDFELELLDSLFPLEWYWWRSDWI